MDNANPSKVIFNTGSSPLINSTLLEQMSDVPEEIIGEISQLYYDFKRIESIQEYRNLLISGDLKLSLQIKKKHDIAIRKSHTYDDFLKTLCSDERGLVEILVSYGKTLHCDVIGNKCKSARYHWENSQKWIKNENAKFKQPQLVFIC